jgi:hypothetical protein
MEKQSFSPHLFVFVAVLLLCSGLAAQTDYCNDIAKKVLQDPTLLDTNIIDIVNNPSCFFQASLSNRSANEAIAPARTSLWNAFESLSGSQQQGSSLSSSGSANAVSKPSGPTALAEEFGGANVTRGASSSTVQWSPGTMFTNLALTGVDYLCLTKKQPEGCISATFLRNLTPLTFKITANTSSGSPSVTGTATTSTSTAPAQQVTVGSKGNSGPSFAGLTVQYSLFGSRNRAAVKSLTSQVNSSSSTGKGGTTSTASSSAAKYFGDEALKLWKTGDALTSCDAYVSWKPSATRALQSRISATPVPNPNSKQVVEVQGEIESVYGTLLTAMLSSQTCQSTLGAFKEFYAAILEAKAYEDFAAVQSSSAKPELALEYDLNTPQNKPSYSSVKATANWQFGKGTPSAPSPTKENPHPERTREQKTLQAYAENQVDILTSSNQGRSTNTGKQLSANSKTLAQANAQPWSFTLMGTADIYNAEPPSSVPSASHLRDIQAGAEIAYLFAPSNKSGALRNFIGSVTASAAYSYQDQTSPAILTGPALTDFTGLPSSTTTAYAQRGVIHLGQVRLGFGTGTNLTFPVAFTYSNRTELVVHPTWGLQFGISYNLTSLFSSSGTTKSGNAQGTQ